MAKPILGLDIGGAHLKAAHTDGAARTVAFPLWKHRDGLTAALAGLCAAMPPHDLLAVTMTGELCDCFPTRSAGVAAILQSALDAAGGAPMRIWTTTGRFVGAAEARADPLRVAAANWLALAHCVARRFPRERVLLIDTGSTTTDIVYLNEGVPQPLGLTDSERLLSGELVYTGVRRTPLCAVFGHDQGVAAEFFATMLDAYVFQGLLPENADDRATADAQPATRAGAHARLARMRCADTDTISASQASQLAEQALRLQWRVVAQACGRVLALKPAVQRVVVSGSGEIVGRSAARGLAETITSLAEVLGRDLSDAACAHAVAALAAQECDHA